MREIIDPTPSWADVAPMLIAVIEDGSSEGRLNARKELRRMGEILDAHNEALQRVKQYDAGLDAKQEAPTGDDYNEVLSLLGITTGSTPCDSE